MKCPKCNKEIDNDSLFCEFCGMRVAKKASEDSQNKRHLNIKKILFYVILIGGLILVSVIARVKSAGHDFDQEQIEEDVISQEWVEEPVVEEVVVEEPVAD